MAKVTFEAMKKCLNLVNSILSQAYTLSDPYLLILFSTLKKVLFEDLHFRNNSFYSIRKRLHRFFKFIRLHRFLCHPRPPLSPDRDCISKVSCHMYRLVVCDTRHPLFWYVQCIVWCGVPQCGCHMYRVVVCDTRHLLVWYI